MKVWLVVFMFNGLPMVSGPYTLETCLIMAEHQRTSHCFNIQTSERKKP